MKSQNTNKHNNEHPSEGNKPAINANGTANADGYTKHNIKQLRNNTKIVIDNKTKQLYSTVTTNINSNKDNRQ